MTEDKIVQHLVRVAKNKDAEIDHSILTLTQSPDFLYLNHSRTKVLDLLLRIGFTDFSRTFFDSMIIEAQININYFSFKLIDFINIAKMCLVLPHLVKQDFPFLKKFTTELPHILPTSKALTATDAVTLLTFIYKNNSRLDNESMEYLDGIICEFWALLSTQDLKNLLWLYNLTDINHNNKILYLLGTLSDNTMKATDNNIKDIFFILVAQHNLTLDLKKDIAEMQAIFTCNNKALLSSAIAKTKQMSGYQSSQGKKILAIIDKIDFTDPKKNTIIDDEWAILDREYNAVLNELRESIEAVLIKVPPVPTANIRKKLSYIKNLKGKLDEIDTDISQYKELKKKYITELENAIKLGSVEACYLFAEALSEDNHFDEALKYYYLAHTHRHPQASFNCALMCVKKATIMDDQDIKQYWFKNAVLFFQHALVTELRVIDHQKEGQKLEENLFDIFYSLTLIGIEINDMHLTSICGLMVMQYGNENPEKFKEFIKLVTEKYYHNPDTIVRLTVSPRADHDVKMDDIREDLGFNAATLTLDIDDNPDNDSFEVEMAGESLESMRAPSS